ncbi:hypothetical protein [Clostridium estertheticum]|uniref:hypothetical protein n=1 Tax=Clostridium estertheticum TaxID=238834 RepID=UPI001C7D051B|nr:hypothetical protein [Clostridium estertheticum]MBX4266548.1 hypothetical protein [Clostridium estertheticum]WLC88112.1 hypothetical protein KTC95_19155 [Clostridium estertheticum]
MSDFSVELLTGGVRNSKENPIMVEQVTSQVGRINKTFVGIVPTSTSAMVPTTLYTVTAGKTFHLTDVIVTNNSENVSVASINNSIVAGTGTIAVGHSINTSPFSMINIGSEPSITAELPVVLQLGASTIATSCAYTVYGYEQ